MSKSKYRNSTGNILTAALFQEMNRTDPSQIMYTLKHEHGKYPSLYVLYMDMMDPTEYTFANQYFEDYSHWTTIAESSWFSNEVTQWRKELILKIKAQALSNIMEDAESQGRTSFAANKYLLSNEWLDDKTAKRGRPSKEEVKQEARKIADDHFRITNDAERLKLN